MFLIDNIYTRIKVTVVPGSLHRKTDKQMDRQINRQTGRQVETQSDRQSGR